MLTLYGRVTSINVQKVLFALCEMNLAFERIDAGLQFGVVDTPEYRTLNPNGVVPTIVDDGFVLWESNAIVRYLAAKHAAGGLWPDNARKRADADRWMDWQATELTPAMRNAFWHLIRVPQDKRDPAAIEASRRQTEAKIAILDRQLAGHRYVTGDALTVADLALGPAAHRWLNLPLAREPRPNIERWYHALMQRPAAQRALPLPIR
jgi:glutathione S-transferase